MKARNNQKGFTIIELVVVILLLGILTATALPRFMDVTDEAHAAVVKSLQGGMQTGWALFHAQWIGEGQPTTAVAGFGAGNLFANTAGYPVGTDNATLAAGDCSVIYNNVMQLGGLPAATDIAYAADPEALIEGVAATYDIVAMPGAAATPTTCVYYYIGQYRSGTALAPHTIPTLTYDTATGILIAGTFDLDTI